MVIVLRNVESVMSEEYLDEGDRAMIDRALDLLELRGDAVGDLRQKLDRIGVGSPRLWRRCTATCIMDQVDMIGAGQCSLDDFIAKPDTGFQYGRDQSRCEFIGSVKDIAQKNAVMKGGEL